MIVRRCLTPTAVFIVLTLLGGFDGSAAERWSRQVSNSEWIPLANPRAATGQQLPQEDARSGLLTSATHLPNPIQSLALPPALQHQYQEQLIQLQKTQESIQKLLLLQQQLRAQQQLLQSQAYVPYSTAEDEKQALPPSAMQAPETLIPSHPSSDALPPIYPSQNFLSQKPGLVHQDLNDGQVALQHGESAEDAQERPPHTYVPKQGSQRPDGKRLKGHQGLSQSSLVGSDEEEEVQLVYVPAETLAQRGQLKRNRGRKPYPVRQQHSQRENEGNIDQVSLSPEQAAFARQVLQQIQKEHEENAHFLKEDSAREFARLNDEQKTLERKTRLQQEALQREQELLRQKEIEKKRKELDRLEEVAKQRELDRIRETREKQRQEELERRRLAEIRAKEEKRREEEARQREERQKQLELENQQKDQLRAANLLQQSPESQALVREQSHRQHLTDGTRKKIRNRPRQRVNQEQSSYHEVATTTPSPNPPSPNQPPLSVYMGSSSPKQESVKVTDVLRLLRDAKTIAVLDNVGPDSPQVFVGPSNLDPPYGYAKFDLPYLSSIDHNRVERKVDKLPFFVAPLSFDPPPGYSKIPFPAPHIGSVVVNTLSEVSSGTPVDEENPNPMPLIEPNSYSDADQSGSIATTTSYDSSSASPNSNFHADSNSPKYESSHSTPPTGSRFRFRQYYDGKPASVVSTSYYEREQSAKAKPNKYYEQESKSTIPQSSKFDTTVSYRQEVSYSSTPSFSDEAVSSHDPSTKEQDLAAQLALINQELDQQRETQRYNAAEQYHGQSNLESYDANDVRAPVGSQYNLPAELPPISPHLPGLINSLLDKQEGNVALTPPPTTTTSTAATTTARVNSTTYRPRTRSRVVPTRSRTTQAPANKTDRTRRPTYTRSKSRFSTTTEEYHETSYEPTKARAPETTQKPNTIEHRRPASRTQKLRTRDRTNPAIQNHNTQSTDFENYPTQSGSQNNVSPDAYSPANGPASNFQQKETPSPGVSDYTRENYSPTTPTQTENYPPLREFTIQHGVPLISGDYSRSQNYPKSQSQEANYRQSATFDQNGFEQAALEMTPVNGFNYQIASVNSPDQTSPARPRYQTKSEDASYNLASTEDPRIRAGEEHRYSPIYEVNVAQAQPDYNVGGQNSFRNVDDKIETDPNASPIFVPLQQSKHEEYELQIPTTERPLVEISTKSTTTPANLIIRQRVRGRLSGSRPHQDSAIQTRPRGSQDEYVRFSVVSHDSTRTNQRQRDGTRTRPRVRPQSHGSQVQTEGNEYIKIHSAQQQRLIATTTPPTTSTTTTDRTTSNEDVDYGFIRPPNFQPVNSPQPVHPVDSRFQTPVTYRPALSEIQHIIPNDETAVESSPAHILKNRPKYQQTPTTRRPTTKTFTTSTTTETVPVATTMPDNNVYMVRQKARPDETKTTRVRGRIRRPSSSPAKKRTTSTTESGLEANNELPLDENYPRITPQQLPVTATGQQPLYDDNFDVTPQFALNRNRPAQYYEESGENYPQEFLLNFGNLPEQSRREEYDQTQLASIHSKKYSDSDHVSSDASSAGDIYGAESQWSTKLSKTSFQPSFASNRVAETKKNRNRIHNDQTNENAPEIITAGPEVPSVTMIVSADYQKRLNNADEMMDVFGKKTNAQDHTEKLNATTAVTSSPTSSETRNWMGREENFTEQMNDAPKMADSTGRKTRRKRIRVRVRPLSNDFVTAESQHYNSAMNSLHRDEYKYNYESKITTTQPITTTIAATTVTATETTKKSMLQDFLEEMLKNDEVSIATRVNFATTESPTTTPYIVSDGETTTLQENHIGTTLIPNANMELTESSTGSKDESQEATSKETVALTQKTEARNKTKSEEYWNKDSQEDQSEQNNLEDIEMLNERYNLSSSYPDGSGTSKEVEDTVAEMTGFPVATEEIRKLSAIEKEKKEHIMTLRRHKVNEGESEAHPKNHRAKWSEVRYPPSALDKSALNSYSTTSFPGVITTRNEGDGSVKTLSDYVKAIFDSMKSAEREDGVEIAKVVESKNETPTNSSRLNNAALVREVSTGESEEINRSAGTTDTSVTQHVKESATNPEEAQSETTTKESVTTFETTTLLPETIANTVTQSEVITEPSTTTSIAKTITSVKHTAGNVAQTNSTILGKVLRTSTTTKVSHMTEICYRGRCVMTKPKMEDDLTR